MFFSSIYSIFLKLNRTHISPTLTNTPRCLLTPTTKGEQHYMQDINTDHQRRAALHVGKH